MKTVLLSQRVEIIESYGERRDCLDQRWCTFLETCGYMPVPVMNRIKNMDGFVQAMSPAGIIFTGGNDLASYGGNAPERDEAERQLMEIGLERGIPILGVCRGMQFIADHFGVVLQKVSGHVACRHRLSGEMAWEVNSYHGYGSKESPQGFDVLARTEDGVIEAMTCRKKKILAVMWHPERETPYRREDIELFTNFIS